MNRQQILEQLKAFPYDRNEYWVITGSAMVIYGIKEAYRISEGKMSQISRMNDVVML